MGKWEWNKKGKGGGKEGPIVKGRERKRREGKEGDGNGYGKVGG